MLQVFAEADRAGHRARAPLVGRRSQLRLLGDVLANVVRERSCSLSTVLGVAGVGKSRLAVEFLRAVDAQVVTGRFLPYGEGITYWPVVSIAGQYVMMSTGALPRRS
jgi:predicted ATPase